MVRVERGPYYYTIGNINNNTVSSTYTHNFLSKPNFCIKENCCGRGKWQKWANYTEICQVFAKYCTRDYICIMQRIHALIKNLLDIFANM